MSVAHSLCFGVMLICGPIYAKVGVMNEKPSPLGSDDESWFIENMKTLRERKGWSQGELARNVAALGWDSFHQTTISRIEKGERPVRLAEARGIAAALEASVAQMTSPPSGQVAHLYELQRQSAEVARAAADLHKAAKAYERARSESFVVLRYARERVKSERGVQSLKEALESEMQALSQVIELDSVQLLEWVEDAEFNQAMEE